MSLPHQTEALYNAAKARLPVSQAQPGDVLWVGYGDGYFRLFSNGQPVAIRGKKAPVVGRVCMDLTMVDVTDIPGVIPGDEAVLYGDAAPVEDGADRAGTIQYELLCDVSPRVPRVYLD